MTAANSIDSIDLVSLALVTGGKAQTQGKGFDWGQLAQQKGKGAIEGAVGGVVTGGITGAVADSAAGGVGAIPGALAGATNRWLGRFGGRSCHRRARQHRAAARLVEVGRSPPR
jgi:hypothetical protein